jgi:tetratricopeptide (TPR) repeat protein
MHAGGVSTSESPDAPDLGRVTSESAAAHARTLDPDRHEAATIGPEGATLDGDGPRGAARLPPGTTVGRYVIEDELGSGGMGVVYGARDPQLERKVAVKLVHANPAETGGGASGPRTSSGASRLLREAQAMAKLHHPNVIVVHDVGTVADQVFIAMEYLDGGTLRHWVEQQRPAWPEILARYLLAGDGLAAAHAAGIVHRDFKPENVLLGGNGRVCVVDFGLARGVAPDPRTEADTTSSPHSLEIRLTQTGAVMGTPAYMAPEQHAGQVADERSDQFSFCVALYEALFGQRPFAGDTLPTLVFNVVEGNLRPPPAGHRVPAYVLAVLTRGLAVESDARFGSMTGLLAALRDDPKRGRKQRWMWGLAGGLALSGVAAGVAISMDDDEPPAPVCVGAEDRIAQVYNADNQAQVAKALATAGGAPAEAQWKAATETLDTYTHDWAVAHTAACEATHVRGEQSEELLDRRMMCLAKGRASVDNLMRFLADADAQVAKAVPALVAALPPVAECDDAETLLAASRLPADQREAILVAYDALERIKNLRTALKYADAKQALEEITPTIEPLSYDPLRASYLYMRAATFADLGQLKEAEEALYEAAIFAAKVGEDGYAATAWIALARVVGISLGRSTEVDPILKAAEAAVARVPDDPHYRGSLLSTSGTIAILNEDYAAAEPQLREAVALLDKSNGPEHDNTLESREMLGVALQGLHRLDEAKAELEAVLKVRERQFGPDHPLLASLLGNLGLISSDRGDHAEAERLYQRCLDLLLAALGPEHQVIVTAHINLGNAQRRQGKLDEALVHLDAALALATKLFDGGPRVAGVHLARIALMQDREQYDLALTEAQAAERIYAKAYDAQHARVADALIGQGRALISLGRAPEAAELLARADAIVAETPDATPSARAESKFELARALWDSDDDRARARTLATEARALLDTDDADPADRTEIDTWLAAHAG